MTTSSIKAKLLALTNYAKKLITLDHLLTQIQLLLNGPLVFKYDNSQIIRLLNTKFAKLFIKLYHVDVYRY